MKLFIALSIIFPSIAFSFIFVGWSVAAIACGFDGLTFASAIDATLQYHFWGAVCAVSGLWSLRVVEYLESELEDKLGYQL